MTEAQWLANVDRLGNLFDFAQSTLPERPFRLKVAAIVSAWGYWAEKVKLNDFTVRAFKLLEFAADGSALQSDVDDLRSELRRAGGDWRTAVAHWAIGILWPDDGNDMPATEATYISNSISEAISRTNQAAIIREVFGNPFRPVAFNPAWRTDTAIAIARTMYDSREFGAMPILADALQDAGCEDEAILNHCRDANQPHVRGCWVVDLVLGKE